MPGRIPENFIRSLLDRADIVEYVGSRLKLTKKGSDHWACCPFHQEKTPSFKVSSDRQTYYCFGCKAKGNLPGFIMAIDNVEFVAAIETLAAHYGMEVPREGGDVKRPDKSLYEILSEASNCFQAWLKDGEAGQEARTYLKTRGFTEDSIAKFKLGYSPPGWDNLLKRLGQSPEQQEKLQKAGLVRRGDAGNLYDMFRGRLMFPIHDIRGRVIGFGARAFGDDQPKYLNSPETPVFHKARELYGLHEARQASRRIDELVLVEGYTDILTLHQAGITNSVATLGTAANQQHFETLFRYADELVCCFDGDTAGRTAARAAMLQALPSLKPSAKLRFAFLPEGEDPDSLVKSQGPDSLRRHLSGAQVFSDYFFEELERGLDLRVLEDKVRLSQLARPEIERLPEGTMKEYMRSRLDEKTGEAPGDKTLRGGQASSQPYPHRGPAKPRNPKAVLRQRVLSILVCYPKLFSALDESHQHILASGESDSLAALAAYLQRNGSADAATIHGFFSGSEHDQSIRRAAETDLVLEGGLLVEELQEGAQKLAMIQEREHQKRMMRERLRSSSNAASEA